MLKEAISERRFLLLDGALGTELSHRGQNLHKKLWSAGVVATDPDAITSVHRDYIEAGSDIVTSASYQMSYEGYYEAGYSTNDVIDFIKRSTRIAQDAIALSNKPHTLVAGSIGTYGAHLADGSEYRGLFGLTPAQLLSWHLNKFNLIASSGVNLVACETIPCIDEAKALRTLITHYPFQIDSWISIACKSNSKLNNGDDIEDFVRCIEDADDYEGSQAVRDYFQNQSVNITDASEYNSKNIAIGVNCTHPQYVEDIIHTLKDVSNKKRIIVAYPNRGDEWDAVTRTFSDTNRCNDEDFANLALKWYHAGASVIGGCCLTCPDTIKHIRNKLDNA